MRFTSMNSRYVARAKSALHSCSTIWKTSCVQQNLCVRTTLKMWRGSVMHAACPARSLPTSPSKPDWSTKTTDAYINTQHDYQLISMKTKAALWCHSNKCATHATIQVYLCLCMRAPLVCIQVCCNMIDGILPFNEACLQELTSRSVASPAKRFIGRKMWFTCADSTVHANTHIIQIVQLLHCNDTHGNICVFFLFSTSVILGFEGHVYRIVPTWPRRNVIEVYSPRQRRALQWRCTAEKLWESFSCRCFH